MGLVDIQSIEDNDVRIHAKTADGVRGSILIYSDQNYGVGSGGTDATVPFFVFRRSFTSEGYFTETMPKAGRYVVLLHDELTGLVDYQYFEIIGFTGNGTGGVSGAAKEYILEFSGQINQNSLIVSAANKIVALLGGKSVYIEGNKLVVVM